MTGFPEFDRYDGLGMAELVRRRQVSPAELAEEAIRRVEARKPALNAVIHPMFESARRTAAGPLPDGPFAGVPFVIKDLIALTPASRSATAAGISTVGCPTTTRRS